MSVYRVLCKFDGEKSMEAIWKILLGILFAFALFGYALVPDNSRDVNRQIPELALLPPFSEVKTIEVPVKTKDENFLKVLFFGSENLYRYVPVRSVVRDEKEVLIYEDFYGKRRTLRGASYKIKSLFFLLGTDNLGRDFFSRLIIGARISLFVGFLAMLLSGFIGFFLGSIGGFFGGGTDRFLLWLMSVLWAIPSVLLALLLNFVLGRGMENLIWTIALVSWTDVARVIRGKTLELKEREFVSAATALGFPKVYILVKHIFPNLWRTLFILSVSTLSSAVLLEAGLSFLGFGVEPPMPSWGLLISENYPYLVITELAHLALLPGFFISLLIFSLFGIYRAMERKV